MPTATTGGPSSHWDGEPGPEILSLPAEEPAETEPVSEDPETVQEPETVTDGRPAVNAPKADWVEYAVTQGWSREDAEAATKADLVEKLREPQES